MGDQQLSSEGNQTMPSVRKREGGLSTLQQQLLWKHTRYERSSKLERLPVRACAVLQAVSGLLHCNGI